MGLVVSNIGSDTEVDGYNASFQGKQSDEASSNKTRALRGCATYGTGEEATWTVTAHGTLVDSANRNRDGATPLNRTDGQRVRIGGQATHRFAMGDTSNRLTVAVEDEFERLKASDSQYFGATDQRRTRETASLVAEWRGRFGEAIDLGAAVRHDDSNRFGSATTLKADAAWKLGHGLTIDWKSKRLNSSH